MNAALTAAMVREASMPKTTTTEGKVPPFPVEVFPELLRNYAHELNRCDRWPLDYTGAAFLFAASVAIGNAFRVKVKEGWNAPAVLWILLVGRPGTIKTHPLESALSPIKRRDADAFDAYRAEHK
ncbi:MAG: DUF3987 domain-containing protein, partial [Planctomycetes bacterium]|nr:DUF3987 domain-containing protein [Planctomycetota bacterium]